MPSPRHSVPFSKHGEQRNPPAFIPRMPASSTFPQKKQPSVSRTEKADIPKDDMFCPGISLDANGHIVVTGGNDSKNTSTYDPSGAGWTSAAEMVIARGYQSSVTVGDGRVFTIGGSWSGGRGGKNGEIYSPATDAWTSLPGCAVAPMLTADKQGVYRADNHAWLFAYKANSVFQAGPSKNMNWYNVSGSGSYTAAGTRAADGDASKSFRFLRQPFIFKDAFWWVCAHVSATCRMVWNHAPGSSANRLGLWQCAATRSCSTPRAARSSPRADRRRTRTRAPRRTRI